MSTRAFMVGLLCGVAGTLQHGRLIPVSSTPEVILGCLVLAFFLHESSERE